METNDLKINTTYQYKCGEEPVKVVYIGENKKYKNTYSFKALEGKCKGVKDTLSAKSVENFIKQIEQ